MRKVKLLILSLGTATLLAACSSADNTSANASTEITTAAADVTESDVETTEETAEETIGESTEAETADGGLTVGEMVTLGDWEIILNSFEITDKIDNTYGSFSPADGNKYVVANITAKNIGTSADTFIGSFTIKNEDVRAKVLYQSKYEYSSSNLLGFNDDLHDKVLNPLTSLTGVLAFEVVDEAANSGDLQLVFTLGKETAAYDLK